MKDEKTHSNDFLAHHKGDETHLFREIVRTNQVLVNRFSREIGMSASRLSLMRILALAFPEEVGVMDISRQLGVNAAAVTRLVKELSDKGLAVRSSDARDGRRNYVTLSAKGLKKFKEIHERTHELERSLASVIDPDETAIAVKVLAELRGFLEKLR